MVSHFQNLKRSIKADSERIQIRTDYYINIIDDAIQSKRADALQTEKEQKSLKLIEAIQLYRRSYKEELEEIVTAEPDWNEETRERCAKKTATRLSESFLKNNLDYTHVEAEKY